MYDGVGDYSEGHVYLKDTGEEHRYGTSVIEELGITAAGDWPWHKSALRARPGHTEAWDRTASLSLRACSHWRSLQGTTGLGQGLCRIASPMPQEEILISKTKDKRPHRLQEQQGNVFSCVQVFFLPTVLLGKPFFRREGEGEEEVFPSSMRSSGLTWGWIHGDARLGCGWAQGAL